jgi:sec-independent protein translocase protein TatB
MFDFSFGEMLVVGLVALVVLGPERLPKAARFIGLWVRRARAQWYSVKSELEREIASEELRQSLADGKQVMRETEAHLRATGADIRAAAADTIAEVRASADADASIADTSASGNSAPVEPRDAGAVAPRQDAHGQ